MPNEKFDNPSEDVEVDVRWKKGSSKQTDNHPRVIMDQEGNYYYAIPFTHSDKKVEKGKNGKNDKTTNYYRFEKDPLGSDDMVYAENHVEVKNKAAYTKKPVKGKITKKDFNNLNKKVETKKLKQNKKYKK